MMRTRYILRSGLALVLLGSLLAACGPDKGSEPFGGGKADSTDKETAAAAAMTGAPEEIQAVYKARCLSCHGSGLEGKVGPKTNLQQVGSRMDAAAIAAQIQKGGGGMPGFDGKLTPQEIEGLAAWLAGKK